MDKPTRQGNQDCFECVIKVGWTTLTKLESLAARSSRSKSAIASKIIGTKLESILGVESEKAYAKPNRLPWLFLGLGLEDYLSKLTLERLVTTVRLSFLLFLCRKHQPIDKPYNHSLKLSLPNSAQRIITEVDPRDTPVLLRFLLDKGLKDFQ